MTWQELPAELRETCERVLTPKQLEVVILKAHRYSDYRIAMIVGIDRRAVRDRRDAAAKKIAREYERLGLEIPFDLKEVA